MRWPLLAVALFVAVAALWIARDPETRRHVYPPGSSLNAGESGAARARAYLQRTGHRVETLSQPLDQASLPSGAVVFRIAPREDERAQDLLSEADRAFVRRGGRLVLALDGDECGDDAEKVAPLLDGVRALESGGQTLPKRAWLDAQPVFECGAAPAIARRPIGAGEAWLIAGPEIFYPGQLGEADNLALLAALAGEARPVWFDESVHGLAAPPGTLQLLSRWGLAPALLLAALALLVHGWRRAALLGPPADPARDLRSDAVELVDSLASLYQSALTRSEALALYRQRIVREIALRLALDEPRAAAVLERYALAAPEPPRLSRPEFHRRLLALASACERFRNEHRRSR